MTHAFFSTSTMFYDCLLWHVQKSKFREFWNEKVTYLFRLPFSLIFLHISIFSFSYHFTAGSDLLLCLLPGHQSTIKRGKFFHGVAMCSCRQLCSEFSVKFLSIFVHISGSTKLITLIWVSLERSFPLAEL